MIIKTSAGQTFRVKEAGSPDLNHVWLGIEVKRTKDGWQPKAKAREILVRKAASTIIED